MAPSIQSLPSLDITRDSGNNNQTNQKWYNEFASGSTSIPYTSSMPAAFPAADRVFKQSSASGDCCNRSAASSFASGLFGGGLKDLVSKLKQMLQGGGDDDDESLEDSLKDDDDEDGDDTGNCGPCGKPSLSDNQKLWLANAASQSGAGRFLGLFGGLFNSSSSSAASASSDCCSRKLASRTDGIKSGSYRAAGAPILALRPGGWFKSGNA